MPARPRWLASRSASPLLERLALAEAKLLTLVSLDESVTAIRV
jgi:hypothetical protein